MCDKGSPEYDFAARQVTVNVAAGATVSCTFTNTQEALLIVKKVTHPDTDKKFDFSSQVFGQDGISLGNGEQSTPVALQPGTYQVSELRPGRLGPDRRHLRRLWRLVGQHRSGDGDLQAAGR